MLSSADQEKILRELAPFAVSVTLASTAAATDANYPASVFTADRAYKVNGVRVVYGTAASGAGTLDVKKRASGVAIGSATSILSSVVALNSTANTPISASMNAAVAVLAAGDTLGLVASTSAGAADACVTFYLEPLSATLKNY